MLKLSRQLFNMTEIYLQKLWAEIISFAVASNLRKIFYFHSTEFAYFHDWNFPYVYKPTMHVKLQTPISNRTHICRVDD